jgi:parallel beta-helix repeat protein
VANSNYFGISPVYSGYSTLTNITASYNGDIGIWLRWSSSNILINITATNNNNVGIWVDESNNISISGALIRQNSNGIFVRYSNYVVVRDSIFQDNIGSGVYLYYGTNNLIYNNLINDSILVFGSHYWNTTLQPGTNIWNSSLGYIGGNLWTNPSNTGYSDTCVDANYDGFCDQPYDLLGDGSNIDYLPLAKYVGQNVPSFSVVFNYNSVDFGTVTPNTIAEAKSINYNVSVTSSSDYKVSVSATDWSGPTTIPANTLYFAVNDTLDNLSFATARQLSNSVQLIATFPSSVTTNYHAFYFNVPLAPPGTYTATITITYETYEVV